ncbi:MAG: hypothetical protein V4671_20510 [Armatimonadota bacterium]
MGSARQDVQRLFGHFGLDPADYIVSFARTADAPAGSSKASMGNAGSDAGRRNHGDRDLFDYRNFELSR